MLGKIKNLTKNNFLVSSQLRLEKICKYAHKYTHMSNGLK